MTRYLTIHVRAHEGRYHGDGEELPSPFRLFQALVAGSGISGPLDDRTKAALTWLEGLPDAPIIASPRLVRGQAVTMFMPNNDLDKFGGDVRNIAKTRGAQKVWKPRHFDAAVPWIYAWLSQRMGKPMPTRSVRSLKSSTSLGVGSTWLGLGARFSTERRSMRGSSSTMESFGDRARATVFCSHVPTRVRSRVSNAGITLRDSAPRAASAVFVQQPKPSYRQISYESPPVRHVFELRSSTDSERRVAWPLEGASSLVIAAREAARARLSAAMPNRIHDVDRHLVGRRPDGSNAVPAESRVRIIAIPSIGMHYADRAIRRLLVEIPAACPLRSEDVRWAFSGAELVDPDTGEVKDVLLSPSAKDDMLRHYGVGAGARVFRSVTPVALPEMGKRRRIEPTRKLSEAKSGLERVVEISGARAAVIQALRHAGVRAAAEAIRLQREPFDTAGSRVELFAEGTRFEKESLWHVEVAFGVPLEGPLLLGDGRFLGLGLMAPAGDVVPGAHAFAITDGLVSQPEPLGVARALRRAIMARVQATVGTRERLAPFFSGHAKTALLCRRSRSSHLSFAFEPDSRRLLILCSPRRRAPCANVART